MRRRTADQILRDLVETGALTNGALGNEARDYIAAQDAAALALKRRERADEAARKRRRDREKQRLGKYEIAPRLDDGVDHSADGIVLIRNASGHRLVWRFGRKCWSARSMLYAPAELQILIPGRRVSESVNGSASSEKASRLSPALLRRCSAHIDLSFGLGATDRIIEALKTKETVAP